MDRVGCAPSPGAQKGVWPMIIIAHRGFWNHHLERNTRESFIRSLEMGYGIETDIRDYKGRLVISHDMATDDSMPVEDLFEIYRSFGRGLTLALNIKSDGLQVELRKLLEKYGIQRYFIFDMAVPDGILYAKQKFQVFTRQSEFETMPAFYGLAHGVWLDEFNGHWITDGIIEDHLQAKKALCIVSPELHNREYAAEWQQYRSLESKLGTGRLMLCTDKPEMAQRYFNE